jgi:hypothetical protein
MSDPLTAAMTKVIEVLSPLESEQRRRVIHAAFALLGEDAAFKSVAASSNKDSGGSDEEAIEGISKAAATWLAKTKITKEQLEQYLHIEGSEVKVIALPGNATKRIDQVLHTYLIQGVAAYVATGDASFSDKDARELCQHFGCYDQTNHAKYIKEFGNRITGSKNSGWKLTAPGLAAAGDLLKT